MRFPFFVGVYLRDSRAQPGALITTRNTIDWHVLPCPTTLLCYNDILT